MKKFILSTLMALVAFVLTANAQDDKTPWQIINMEEVQKHGKFAEFDAETATVTFSGKNDRWIDVPGVSGDLTGHTKISMTLNKSNVKIKVCMRYIDNEGKTKQVDAVKLYSQTGKVIKGKKTLKFDLKKNSNGKVTDEMLENVKSIRIAMLGTIEGEDEPWEVSFGDFVIE